MIYILKTAGGTEVARASVPIVNDGGTWATPSQRWLDPKPGDGSHVDTTPDPTPVPFSVTRGQALSAIYLSLGKTIDDLVALTTSAPDPQKTLMQIDIKERLLFERSNPTLQAMATALGLSSAQLDSLFILAATL